MSILHTVNKSPFERANLDSCLKHVNKGDAVVLYEDAVIAAGVGTAFAARIADAAKDCKICVLGADLKARGLDPANVVPGVTVIDYADFVDLAAENASVHAWL